MTTPDPSREAFGRHVRTENGIFVRGLGWLNRDELGAYKHPDIQARWLTWQAAMAHKGAELQQAHEARRQAQTELATMQEKRNRIGLDIDRALRGEVNEQSPIAGRLKLIAEANRWQPIETAPRDGTQFLAFRPLAHITHDANIKIVKGTPHNYGCWEATVPPGYSLENFTDGACRATHWQPLPAAPKQEGITR